MKCLPKDEEAEIYLTCNNTQSVINIEQARFGVQDIPVDDQSACVYKVRMQCMQLPLSTYTTGGNYHCMQLPLSTYTTGGNYHCMQLPLSAYTTGGNYVTSTEYIHIYYWGQLPLSAISTTYKYPWVQHN